jgi:hypothetical protein
MSSDANSRTPKIRTFASDLNEAREKRPDHDHTKKTPGSKKEDIEVLAAPTRSSKPDHEKKTTQKPIPIDKPEPTKRNKASNEIEKQVAVLNKQSENLSDAKNTDGKDKKPRPNIGYDATVITDTKHKRFKLLPSIFDSINKWFRSLTKKKKKSTPQYTVEQANRRKGVIQKATTKSGSIFTADSDDIKERIKRRQSQKREVDPAETFWTPFTEIGYRLLDKKASPDLKPKNVELEFKKSASPQIINDPSTPEPAAKEETSANSETKDLDELRWQQTPVEPEVTKPIENNQAYTVEKISQSEVDPVEQLPKNTQNSNGNNYLAETDTNTLTIVIMLIIVSLLIVGVAGKIIFEYLGDNSNTTAEQSVDLTLDKIINESDLKPVTLTSNNLNNLAGIIDLAISENNSYLTELPIITRQNEEVSPSYIFNLLGFDTLPTLRQSLISVRFLTFDNRNKLLVFDFIDELTVRGGMLFWEASMTRDLQSIFADLPPTNDKFVDEIIQGVDARVIRDNGEFIVGYIIIDNLVIISATENDLMNIIGVINN